MSSRLRLVSTYGWFGDGELAADLKSLSTFGWFQARLIGRILKIVVQRTSSLLRIEVDC